MQEMMKIDTERSQEINKWVYRITSRTYAEN